MVGAGETFDVCIVGGGLIGLAFGSALLDTHAGMSILILEKEPELAFHQSGHNSGVVHSGLYYKPGSLKARLCVDGRRAIYDSGIPVKATGKLVVATSFAQLPALEELEKRGRANGLARMRRITSGEISEHEPRVTGIAALHVPEAGVTDFGALAAVHADRLKSADAAIHLGVEVTAIQQEPNRVRIIAGDTEFLARSLVNCAGLQSDLVARMAEVRSDVRIIPFRGEYYRLSDSGEDLVRGLVYPVPDPKFPFLGIHFTRRIDGSVEVGPNAVLALGREHYRDSRPDWSEVRSILKFRGFRRLAQRHWWSGAKELVNSRSKRLYARQARRLIPDLEADHLIAGGVGVRAQAVDLQGKLVDDFVIEPAGRTIHVLNAPSPGATASIAIGRHLAANLERLL